MVKTCANMHIHMFKSNSFNKEVSHSCRRCTLRLSWLTSDTEFLVTGVSLSNVQNKNRIVLSLVKIEHKAQKVLTSDKTRAVSVLNSFKNLPEYSISVGLLIDAFPFVNRVDWKKSNKSRQNYIGCSDIVVQIRCATEVHSLCSYPSLLSKWKKVPQWLIVQEGKIARGECRQI